jgi:hypothetical protein
MPTNRTGSPVEGEASWSVSPDPTAAASNLPSGENATSGIRVM